MSRLDFNLDRVEHIPGLMVRTELVLFAISHGELQLFMVDRGYDTLENSFELPGGYMLMDASLEESANMMVEQLGFRGTSISHFDLFTKPNRDRRGRTLAAAYWGAVNAGLLWDRAGSSAQFQVARLRFGPRLTLVCDGEKIVPGVDHLEIITSAVGHLRAMLDNSTLAFRFLPSTFTLLELQQVHEAILGQKLETMLFRKRLLGRIFPDGTRLRATDETRPGKGRPARLYRRIRAGESPGAPGAARGPA